MSLTLSLTLGSPSRLPGRIGAVGACAGGQVSSVQGTHLDEAQGNATVIDIPDRIPLKLDCINLDPIRGQAVLEAHEKLIGVSVPGNGTVHEVDPQDPNGLLLRLESRVLETADEQGSV